MYKNNKVTIVIPCYNEEKLLAKVIEGLPSYIDHIIIIDDVSTDATYEVAKTLSENDKRIIVIRHEQNMGVGGAISTGYKKALVLNSDVAVVMAGDAQMDPLELPAILDPVIEEGYDYSKGDRLSSGQAWEMIPKIRYLGNSALSLLTKIASGYWHVKDSQSGYTAISKKALQTIDWDKTYKRYGQPNDLLVRLNIHNFRVKDVPIRPIYNIGEQSGIKPMRMIPRLSWLLFRLFWYRMLHKYVIRDFHPLVFFYFMSSILIPTGAILGGYLLFYRLFNGGLITSTSALFSAFLLIMGFQFMFFAMWFDMEANKDLK